MWRGIDDVGTSLRDFAVRVMKGTRVSLSVDFSMTALFLVVMTEQWKASRDHTPALVGLGVSLVCLLIFGSSDFLIPSMVGITAALTVLRGFMQKKEADHAV